MKTYFIYPLDYSSKYEQQYIDYTKREALKLFKEKFPQFTSKELVISRRPYLSF